MTLLFESIRAHGEILQASIRFKLERGHLFSFCLYFLIVKRLRFLYFFNQLTALS